MNQKIDFKKKIGLELFRRIQKNSVKMHELKTLFWECTLRCNLSCRHCGSDCKKEAGAPDMPVADFLKVIDEITPHVNPNKTLITIVGGEALVRNDIEECGRYLYDHGFPWGIVTNGMLLTRERLDSLMGAGMRSLAISLDGFEEVHNNIRRNDQSYKRAIAAVKMLVNEPDIVWDIVTCATPLNFGSLKTFKEFLVSLGVKRWRIFTVFPVGRAAEDTELQITDSEFQELMEFIKTTRQEGIIDLSYGCEGFMGNYETEIRDNFYHCSAGVNVASILVDGSISGCTSIRSKFHQGNIYKDSFVDVWENRFEKYRNRAWTRKGQCAECNVYRYCMGNGMHLYDENENLLLCHYNRLR